MYIKKPKAAPAPAPVESPVAKVIHAVENFVHPKQEPQAPSIPCYGPPVTEHEPRPESALAQVAKLLAAKEEAASEAAK